MIAYRELESPETPYSPAKYRIVELSEAEMTARILGKLGASIEEHVSDEMEVGR